MKLDRIATATDRIILHPAGAVAALTAAVVALLVQAVVVVVVVEVIGGP